MADDGSTLLLLDVSAERPALLGHRRDLEGAVAIAFSPDGALLAVSCGGSDPRVELFKVASYGVFPRQTLDLQSWEGTKNLNVGLVTSMVFLEDGHRIVLAGQGGVVLWDSDGFGFETFPE